MVRTEAMGSGEDRVMRSEAALALDAWCETLGGEPIFVAHPGCFDWQWINDLMWQKLGRNPFGYRALCLRSLGYGIQGCTDWGTDRTDDEDFFVASAVPHHALYDAKAQAEQCKKLIRWARRRMDVPTSQPDWFAGPRDTGPFQPYPTFHSLPYGWHPPVHQADSSAVAAVEPTEHGDTYLVRNLIEAEFLTANRLRCSRWHGDKPWTAAEMLVATMGELGELAGEIEVDGSGEGGVVWLVQMVRSLGAMCNAAKKTLRVRDGIGEADLVEQVELIRNSAATLREALNISRLDTLDADSVAGRFAVPAAEVTALPGVGSEWADVFTYLTLLADSLGVDPQREVVRKFNDVSQRSGFPERLSITAP